MKSYNPMGDEADGFSIDSMLDIVFLLLIYFMVTAAFVKEEADISMSLPSRLQQDEPLDMPEEQVLDIMADGSPSMMRLARCCPNSPARFRGFVRRLMMPKCRRSSWCKRRMTPPTNALSMCSTPVRSRRSPWSHSISNRSRHVHPTTPSS